MIWPSVRQPAPPENGTAWPYVWKAPILVRSRARVTLAIASEAIGKAGLWRHRDGSYVSAVRFLACRERQPVRTYRGTVGKFTQFPFAVALTTPAACVPMDVMGGRGGWPARIIVPVGHRPPNAASHREPYSSGSAAAGGVRTLEVPCQSVQRILWPAAGALPPPSLSRSGSRRRLGRGMSHRRSGPSTRLV